MKKAIRAIAGVLFAGTLAAFVGCDWNKAEENFKATGNFQEEATQEQLLSAFASVNPEQAFGNIAAANWEIGFNIEGALNAEVSSASPEVSAKASLAFNYALSVKKDETQTIGYAIAGKGNAKTEINATKRTGGILTSGETKKINAVASGNVYNDNTAIYLDYSLKGFSEMGAADTSAKAKVLMSDVIDYAMSNASGMIPEKGEGSFELSTFVGEFAEMGFKAYIDDSNGLKIKLGATEETLLKILQNAGYSSFAEFETFLFDVYIVFDGNGSFRQISYDLDVKGAVMGFNVAIKGGLKFAVGIQNVTLPKGLAEDPQYVQMPMGKADPLPPIVSDPPYEDETV